MVRSVYTGEPGWLFYVIVKCTRSDLLSTKSLIETIPGQLVLQVISF